MKTVAMLFLMATVLFASSCKREDVFYNPATLKIMLTDAPAAYDAVNIDIQSISIRVDSGWYDFNVTTPGVYDLISLSNGTTALLVPTANVPAGTITEMRLHLGGNNTIIVDGVTHNLKTPSGQSSGYKVKMNSPLVAGTSYQLLIDFDADKSIVKQGNGNYLLKPVVHGSLVSAIGQIDGIAVPDSAASLASAWNATDTFNVYPSAGGYFLINSLLPGNYSVKITANPPYHDTTLVNIPVTAGQTTHLDTLLLH